MQSSRSGKAVAGAKKKRRERRGPPDFVVERVTAIQYKRLVSRQPGLSALQAWVGSMSEPKECWQV